MKKLIALLMATIMILGCFAGCSNEPADTPADPVTPAPAPSTPADPSTPATPAEPDKAVDPATGIAYAEDTVYDYLYASEITSMNYLTTSVSQNQKSLANFVDTLIEFDCYGNIQPCLAESWSVSDDGLTWTFNIRKGVKWYTCEGEEYADLTAHDFVYAARLVSDPKFDSDMPNMLIDYVVNGTELYNWSDETTEPDFTTLGVEATDDYTLVYHLKAPCAYFLTLLTYGCYLPINGDFYETLVIENPEPVINDDGTEGDPITNEFGTDRDKILYCGGYICSSWMPQEEYVWVKNENYWDADNIFITKVNGKYNAQADAIAPEMYLRGEIDECNVTTAILDDWMNGENADVVHNTMPTGFVQYMLLCFDPHHEDEAAGEYYKQAVNNKNFRKSIAYGIDKLYVMSAYDPYTPEAIVQNRLMPTGFAVTNNKDYNEYGDMAKFNETPFNEAEAQKYRDLARAELEAAGCVFPIQIPLYYNPSTANMDQNCQLLEAQLESTLGNDYIEITVYSGPSTNYIGEVRRPGKWGLFEGGWGPDYVDPSTFFEPFSYGWTYGTQEAILGDEYKTGYIYTQEDYDKGIITDDTLIGTPQYVFNSLVEKAKLETQDMAKRYELFAEAEAFALEEVLMIPYRLLNNGYVASNMSIFDGAQCMAGICGYKYKGRHMLEKSYNMDEYNAAKTAWEAAKAAQ